MSPQQQILTPPVRAWSAPRAAADALQTRFALRVTAALGESARGLDADVQARLRFAREQALERARVARKSSDPRSAGVATASRPRWWLRLATLAPAVALVTGLVLIQRWQDHAQIAVAADVDAALLTDDLPPKAYGDAGFAEFLKSPTSTP